MNSHSLASLIKSAADNGIFLSLKDGKLSVKVKKDTLTNEDILREIRSHKTALQNWLMQYQAIESPSDFIKKLSPIPDKFPLSGDQERLWLLYQLNDDSSYHVPFAVMLNGKVDAQVLTQAFHVLLQRQQVLSTFFLREGDSLFQKVMNANLWRLEVCNISLEQLQPAIQQEMQVRFDLVLNFPIRAKLFKIKDAEDSFCLLITTHHIAIDGQSLPILWQELVNAYNTLAKGLPVAQDPLPIQYREFALWQKHQFETDSFTSKIDFWHKKLTEVPRLELADDYPADNRVAQVGRTFRSKVNAELSACVLNRCSEKGVSPFIYTLAVFKVLLYKYTQQRQICLGFPITERWHAELEPLVGLFVNTLPIYTELSEQETFDSLLEAVKQSVLEAYKYKEVPFEKIVERLSIARDTRINPIFEIVFAAYHSDTATNVTELTDVSVEQVDFETQTAKFALNCAVNIIDGNLTVSMEYDASRYSHDKIAQLTKHYLTLLELCTSNGAQLVRKLNFLDSNDKLIVDQTLLADIPYPLEMTVLSKFEEQVRLYPQNTAIHFDGIDFTYDYLNRRVNQLAHYLIEQGVVLEQPVVVCTHRTPYLLISLLAVMKAGGVYVPVNPAYPEERIRFIIDNCQPQIVITDQADFNVTSSQVICLSKEASIIASYSDTNPAIPIFPNNLLYIIYTSGTTGKPKGVMIEHQNVVRLFFTDSPLFDFGPTDTWTLFHSFCFDFSVWEMYGALLYGGKLVIVNEEQVKDITAFANLLDKEGVTVLNQTPAAFYNLQEELLAIKRSLFLRYIIFGGEALHPSKLASWHSSYPACKLINMYGITETTVHVTYKQIGKREIELGASNIGCAIPTLGCLVLSEDGDLMPPGSIGELFVIGAGLARGYLNRPELTASRFLDNPYNRGTRMYKSGDRVYIGLDGELRYIGRSDAQVKIRGHRIEVGEVENVLLALAEVDKGVVTVFENNGHNRLVAYVVPTVGKSRLDIAMSLQSKLPDFMVPSVIVLLEEIPLTSNGKVDKKRLPSPEKFLIQDNAYAAPQHPVEVEICKIWQRLLGVERIGINDNFFDLGGDSIISMQVVNQINKAGFSVSARDIFTYQTIATLAQKILQHQSIQRAEQGILLGELPLLPIQYQFLNDSWSGMHHYNQGFLLAISKQIPVKHIEDALKQIVLRHDSLRIQISRSDAGWHQSYTNCEVSFTTELIDDDEPNQVKAHITDICNGYQQSFHLEKSNLFAAVLICTPTSEEKNRLFLVAHHLIVDAVSWRIILNDLEQLLSNSEREVAVIAKGNSIREWANDLKAYAVSERALAQVPFWQQIVDKYQPIPIDKTASTSFRKDCMEVTVSLDGTYTGWLIKEAHKAYHTEMNDLLLGALLISIGKWIKRHHIVVGLESHGRDGFGSDLNVSNTVGWFTSVYPVELVAMDFSDLEGIVSGVKEQLRTVPDKGIGFGALAYLNPTVALLGSFEQRQPWDIVFNYLGRFDNIIGSDSVLDGALESKGDYCSADTPWRYKLEINCSIQDGQLNMSWTFSQNEFEIPVIESLAKSYLSALKKIIEHCKEQISPKYTPSDFGLAPDVNIEQLNTFLTSPMGRLVQQVCRLSPLQEGMLFHGLYEGKVSSYQEQFTCYLPGDIDVVVLKRSWESLLRKHSILRSCLLPDTFAIPVLCVNKEAVLPFHIIDYSVYDEQERNQLFSRLLETDLSEAIPFNKAPLMRITLVKWDSAGYRMIWTHHHSIMDGWSLSIVLSELIQAYERLSNNLVPENSIEDKYEDYIQFLAQQDVWKAKDFWTQYLSGFTTPTLLPQLKRAGASNRTGGHSNVHVWKPNDILSDQINNFIKSNQLTANTLIQGVWAFLLAKYTNSSDVVYGVTVSGRPSVNDSFQKGIGLYINTIPLRAKLGWEQSISNWLQQIQREQTESREYQYSSLNQIQAWNKLPEDWFDTILIYENYPLADVSDNSFALQIEGGTFKERTNYALNIVAGMAPTLRVEFNYNSNLLRLEEVEQICEHFENTIRQFCQPTMLLGDVDILTDSERFRMLQTYNATTRENSTFSSLVQCFEHYVAQIPHRPALIFETNNWTYGELNHIATNLAAQLQAGGVVAGELVGVCMERSAEMIVAILAILKIGAAYVPIDPNYPSERKKYMLSDAGIHSILIAHPDSLHFMDNHAIKQYLVSCKDLFNSALLRCPDLVNIQPHDLAYVIYTSGSTGRPKGVMISHGAALNMSQSLIRLFGIVESDNVLQFASLSFDASVYEICTAFCSGASLTVIRKEIIDDATLFAEYIKRHGVTVATLPPAYLAAIPADCLSGLKLLITAGEAPDAAKAVQLSRQLRYFNAYGPTECAVCVTAHEVFPDDDISNGIPIGTPIDNLRVYILDEHGKLVPEGIIGELFVSGVGLSKGYWKKPELTNAKFIPCPYEKNAMMYKTGDLVRWLPGGRLAYHGRIDHQVKIRGYRIELAEIEQCLKQLSDIHDAVVQVFNNDSDTPLLVAYLVCNEAFDVAMAYAHLSEQLPSFMMPSTFLKIAHIPLTANGKVDTKALPVPIFESISEEQFMLPITAEEGVIMEIWRQLLGEGKWGIHHDFFRLGGHSLLIMRMAAAIKIHLGVQVPVQKIYELRTISKIAAYAKQRMWKREIAADTSIEVFEL